MKPQARRDIKFEIRMVNTVQAPKCWHSVEQEVLQLDRYVQCHHSNG